MLSSDVIQQLDEQDARPGVGFPYFGVTYPVDARLSAYRDATAWALVIETLVFNDGTSGHFCCETVLYCYGNELPEAPGICYPVLNVTADGPTGPLFDPTDVIGQLVSPLAADMTIRGKIVPVSTDPAEYGAAGIKLCNPPRIQGFELLRLLAPTHRRLFFATEKEIEQRLGRRMPLLLRLDEWWQPDKGNDQRPSDSESFQMIAQAIAANDPRLYQPTEPPNTHWSNWPNAGML